MTDLLIIDDDKGLDELLGDFLAGQGYSVRTAENGKLGLRAMYERQPDIVLLDVTMPEKDGWETLRRIREISNLPVIMLTARGDEADILQGFSLGADDYVTKPFSFAQLSARIHAVLGRSAQENAAETKLSVGWAWKSICASSVYGATVTAGPHTDGIQAVGDLDAPCRRCGFAEGSGQGSVGGAICQRDRARPALHLASPAEDRARPGKPPLHSQ